MQRKNISLETRLSGHGVLQEERAAPAADFSINLVLMPDIASNELPGSGCDPEASIDDFHHIKDESESTFTFCRVLSDASTRTSSVEDANNLQASELALHASRHTRGHLSHSSAGIGLENSLPVSQESPHCFQEQSPHCFQEPSSQRQKVVCSSFEPDTNLASPRKVEAFGESQYNVMQAWKDSAATHLVLCEGPTRACQLSKPLCSPTRALANRLIGEALRQDPAYGPEMIGFADTSNSSPRCAKRSDEWGEVGPIKVFSRTSDAQVTKSEII